MFNHYENEIYSISEKGYEKTNIDEDKKIINYLENGKVRYDKIFHEIFIFLDNDTKLIFTASGKFCKYLIKSSNFFENIDMTQAEYKKNVELVKEIGDKIYDNNRELEERQRRRLRS